MPKRVPSKRFEDVTVVAKRSSHAPRPVVEPARPFGPIDDDEDEYTLIYRPFEPSERLSTDALDLDPQEPDNEPKEGMALSRTLRPLAAGLRSLSWVHALSISALILAGAGWYLAQTMPVESVSAPATASLPAASPPPAPVPETLDAAPPPLAAPPSLAAPPPFADVVPVAPRASKPFISVSDLPAAPPSTPPRANARRTR